ncbi:MAG: hypothetical protein QM750_18105 [Rubrivivax sp.]
MANNLGMNALQTRIAGVAPLALVALLAAGPAHAGQDSRTLGWPPPRGGGQAPHRTRPQGAHSAVGS